MVIIMLVHMARGTCRPEVREWQSARNVVVDVVARDAEKRSSRAHKKSCKRLIGLTGMEGCDAAINNLMIYS